MIHNAVNNRCINSSPARCWPQPSPRDFTMVPLLVLMMLAACAASPEDLSGKMFTFPQQSNTAQVRLTTTKDTFSAATVCLRSMTDLSRDHAIFSLATPGHDNGFLIYSVGGKDTFSLNVQNIGAVFEGQDYKLNVWHSICATWDSKSGLAQLWLDGKPSVRKFVGSSSITSPIVILGQDQDSYGGTFDEKQSFVGMISDIHMWDYALSPCDIQRYVNGYSFTPGNVLNWRQLEFQISGRVLLEEAQLWVKVLTH